MKNNTTHIRGFDGLRAISIIMVLLSHLSFYDDFFLQHPFSGTAGVNIFFCLSGFLITWLLLKEKQQHGKIGYMRFYIRRFFRLAPPLIVLFLALLTLGFFHMIHISKWGILLSAAYLYNYAPNTMYDKVLGSTWSLALEEQFYLFWPSIVGLLVGSYKILIAALTVIFLCVIAKLFIYNIHFDLFGHSFFLGRDFQANRFFFPAVGPVIIGAIFAIISFMHRVIAFFKKYGSWILILSLLLYFFPLYSNTWMLNFSDLIQATGIGFLLLYLYVFNQNDSVVGKLLDIAPFSYIGKISYGIYVYQCFFITTAGKGELVGIQSFPQNIILTLVVSMLSYHFWEKWAMKYRDKLLQKLNLRK
jgi:peptidoglycan/LPS O-acetylase OafA/YrhL